MLKVLQIIMIFMGIFLMPLSLYAAESNVIIFVSFSMPEESIKEWIRDAKLIHAPVVIRGLIHNSFKETTHKMAEIVEKERGGVELNPLLFKKYHIKKVPAVVLTHGGECLPDQSCDEQFNVIYGDAELEYALNQFTRLDDVLSPFANAALQQLRWAKKHAWII